MTVLEDGKVVEIDQRHKDTLQFNCSCGGTHQIEFSIDVDDPRLKEYWISTLEPFNASISERVKVAIKYIWQGSPIYHSNVGLTSEDLKKVKEQIDKYLAIN